MTSRKHDSDGPVQSRKDFFFETHSRTGEYSPAIRKSVAEYLRDTPPAPLSIMTKGILIALGVLVVILFAAILIAGLTKLKAKPPCADTPRISFFVDSALVRAII